MRVLTAQLNKISLSANARLGLLLRGHVKGRSNTVLTGDAVGLVLHSGRGVSSKDNLVEIHKQVRS